MIITNDEESINRVKREHIQSSTKDRAEGSESTCWKARNERALSDSTDVFSAGYIVPTGCLIQYVWFDIFLLNERKIKSRMNSRAH
uniref:Uncharacterized protein n=1 Tax=Vespula pensylvanica TaxID=30213 RepID=A0A834NWM7_VESPE|nr:hypothetical protein H0235_010202 [Vespula pensylvanica]